MSEFAASSALLQFALTVKPSVMDRRQRLRQESGVVAHDIEQKNDVDERSR